MLRVIFGGVLFVLGINGWTLFGIQNSLQVIGLMLLIPGIISVLQRLAHLGYYQGKRDTPERVMEVDAVDGINVALAKNRNTATVIQNEYFKSEDESLREALVSNPDCPTYYLEELSNDEEIDVRVAIAANEKTPVSVLRRLAYDNETRVIFAAISNPNMPVDDLVALSDPDLNHFSGILNTNTYMTEDRIKMLVLDAVAKNPSTPTDIILRLFEDGHANPENPNLPPECLEALAAKGLNPMNASELLRNPKTPLSVLRRYAHISKENNPTALVAESLRISVAGNQALPEDLLEELSRDDYWPVRATVAGCRWTPTPILLRLAKDPQREVRLGALRNPSMPLEVLLDAAQSDVQDDRFLVSYNPALPVDILRHLSEDSSEGVRWGVAANPNTPIDTLALLAEDSSPIVRQNVAGNTNTPTEVLTKIYMNTQAQN